MVSIVSLNGRCGGCAMVRRSGVATKAPSGSGRPSTSRPTTATARRRRAPAGPGAVAGLGRRLSFERTRLAVGCSETSRRTSSTSQSGGR